MEIDIIPLSLIKRITHILRKHSNICKTCRKSTTLLVIELGSQFSSVKILFQFLFPKFLRDGTKK